jgi:RNA polymerase sigma-70 factor, ECF subfamily
MSRYEEKKYHEIAKELNISIKTVETQMSRALKVMREVLGSYLMYVIVFSLIMLIEGCRGKI